MRILQAIIGVFIVGLASGQTYPGIINPAVGCRSLMDFVAVIDGSDSITAGDYMKLKIAVVDLVEQLDIAQDQIRFGLVLFSSDVITIPIGYNKQALKDQIINLPHPRSGTNTALALREMREMLRVQGRPNVPTVGLVITDGISIDGLETAMEARLAKAAGVKMFAVGVGQSHIDIDELNAIASDDTKVITVTDFDQLALGAYLTNVAIQICPETTTPYVPTTPVPTTPAPLKLPGLCDGCKIWNGAGYNKHPTDCDKFIQCYLDSASEPTAVIRKCPDGLFWDQDTFNCKLAMAVDCPHDACKDPSVSMYEHSGNCRGYWECDSGRSYYQCCPEDQAYEHGTGCVKDDTCYAECPAPIPDAMVCDMRPVAGMPGWFEQNVGVSRWILMPCAPGTHFSAANCNCSILVDYTIHRQCKPDLNITFDQGMSGRRTLDRSSNRWYVQNINVKVENGIGYFDGNSRLNIPRYTNLEFGDTLIIKLRYKEEGVSTAPMALVTNGDCGLDYSILMAKDQQNVYFGVKTEYSEFENVVAPVTAAEWKDVTYIVNSGSLEGRVGGTQLSKESYGQVESRDCSLQVGRGMGLENFVGYIDEVVVYLCRPSDI